MLLATTAYITLIDMDKAARARSELVNNLSFSLEDMTRSIRTGTGFACDDNPAESWQSCYWGTNCFSFVDQEGHDVTYVQKDDGTIGRYIGSYANDRSCSSSSAIAMTDPAVHIEHLTFYPSGMAIGDGNQPSVLIVLQGYIDVLRRGETVRSEFSIQTRATQRQFDI